MSKAMKRGATLRNFVLGGQLDVRSAAFEGFDVRGDAIWMAKVVQESEKVWLGKPRVAIFLATMEPAHYHTSAQSEAPQRSAKSSYSKASGSGPGKRAVCQKATRALTIAAVMRMHEGRKFSKIIHAPAVRPQAFH